MAVYMEQIDGGGLYGCKNANCKYYALSETDENSFIQNFDSETRVSQYFYDKEGNIIPDERVMTIHFDESAFE